MIDILYKISPLYRNLIRNQDKMEHLQTLCSQQYSNLSQQLTMLSEQLDDYLQPYTDKFTGHYEYWRAKRVTAIVEYYGENWFKGKKILELGCGYGDIGYIFMTLGADVVFAEGRSENINCLRRRFPNGRIYQMNAENEWPFAEDENFDLILHMGLLYHLDNIWFLLDQCCKHTENIVLETEVADTDDEDFILKINEPDNGWDQSLDGRGTRPSGACIEKHLNEQGFLFERVCDSRCNALFHRYDWKIQNTGTWENGLRRFWFCKRKGV